jgi:hypothetical protein
MTKWWRDNFGQLGSFEGDRCRQIHDAPELHRPAQARLSEIKRWWSSLRDIRASASASAR